MASPVFQLSLKLASRPLQTPNPIFHVLPIGLQRDPIDSQKGVRRSAVYLNLRTSGRRIAARFEATDRANCFDPSEADMEAWDCECMDH